MLAYNIFVFIYVSIFAATSFEHIIKSYKARNQTGIMEGTALFFVFIIILCLAYNKVVS